MTPRQLSTRINTLRKEAKHLRVHGRTTAANRKERELKALVTDRLREQLRGKA